ncbi:MAG: hypothetical protein ACOX9C_01270 [Kiritimatiellia bacterium]|jgi:hypothetical protein
MSPSDPNIIDGFKSVQAMKRAAARASVKPRYHNPADKDAPADPPSAPADPPPATAARPGGHVVVPKKQLVICYACGYAHTLSGKVANPYCPKCRLVFKTEDVVVAGPHSEDIVTIGNVTIAPEAAFAPGVKVTGQNILLDGDATPLASVVATESIEIGARAKFDPSVVNNLSGVVRIPAGNDIVLEARLSCAELEIFGTLRASVSVMKSARIHSGGALVGAFQGPTLFMEDGAGLFGEIDLSPAHRQEPPRPSRARPSPRG